jgi:hypothetical protein
MIPPSFPLHLRAKIAQQLIRVKAVKHRPQICHRLLHLKREVLRNHGKQNQRSHQRQKLPQQASRLLRIEQFPLRSDLDLLLLQMLLQPLRETLSALSRVSLLNRGFKPISFAAARPRQIRKLSYTS